MPIRMYTSPADLIEYARQRGTVIEEDEAQALIMAAQDYIDGTYSFLGEAVHFETAFPRTGLERFSEDVIPEPVRQATMQVAIMLKNGVPLTEGVIAQAQIKREVVSTNKIETEYATNYRADPVQRATTLPSLVRLFTTYDLLNPNAANVSINLTGWRG